MVQLVGLNCVICQRTIDSILEGGFCEACYNPVHRSCLNGIDTSSIPEGKCPACGGDIHSPIAMEAKRGWEEEQRRKGREAADAQSTKERAAAEAERRRIFEERSRTEEEAKTQYRKEFAERSSAYNRRRMRVMGLGFIGIGLMLIFPNLKREGQFKIDLESLVPGLGAVVAGGAVIALSFAPRKKPKEDTTDREKSPDS